MYINLVTIIIQSVNQYKASADSHFSLLKFLKNTLTQYACSETQLPSNSNTSDKRNKSAFCLVSTFKQPTVTVLRCSPLYKPRLAQYCHSLHRLGDKHLKKRRNLCASDIYCLHTNQLAFQTTVLHMGYMKRRRNTEFSCDNSLHQSRFKTTLSFMRQAGLLINNTSPSKFQTSYTTVGAVCFYTTWICTIMDTYVHRYDITIFMERMPWVFGLSIAAWMKFICR